MMTTTIYRKKLMSEYPFIEYVAKAIAVADGQTEEEWEAYDELATAAIRSIKDWFDGKKEI